MDLPKRKRNRLTDYDYSQNGLYFITICVKDRQKLLGDIVGGGVLDAPQIDLSEYGIIVNDIISEINSTYTKLSINKYVIMPNHIHFLIAIYDEHENGTSRTPSPTNAVIPMFVSTFKRFTNKRCCMKLFQRSYHDHIIRDERDYRKIWNYIDTNPAKWQEDCFYTE